MSQFDDKIVTRDLDVHPADFIEAGKDGLWVGTYAVASGRLFDPVKGEFLLMDGEPVALFWAHPGLAERVGVLLARHGLVDWEAP